MIYRLILLSFLLLPIFSVSAQNGRLISGQVRDAETQNPLPGATVIIKGTARGAITDKDGNFTYRITPKDLEGLVLEVSFIGYETQEFVVGEKNSFIIDLEKDLKALAEVVVTSSYGTKKLKQEVVGSITSINTSELIQEQAVSSIDQLLEGQSTGLYVESGEGLDAPNKIHIRGVGSLNTGNVGSSTQPLIIVDGVILNEEISIEENNFFDLSKGRYDEDPSNPLSRIGITDIESINILKDAAAVSLYGADGANGVIIITTKGGKAGKLKARISTNIGISDAINPIQFLNGKQYNELRNLYYTNSGNPEKVVPWNGISTDWQELTRRKGLYQNYTVSVSGGKKNWDYRGALSYQDIKDPQIENGLRRVNGNFSLGYQKEKLHLSLKLNPSFSERNNPNKLFNYALRPDIAPYDEQGNFTTIAVYGNPLAVAYQNEDITNSWGLMGAVSAVYQLHENLKISSLWGMDYASKDMDIFRSGENETGNFLTMLGERQLRERISNSWNWNANVSYEKNFNKDQHFDVLVGVETRSEKSEQTYKRGRGFTIYDRPQDLSLAEKIINDEEDSAVRTGRSLFSQINYNYRKTYFLLLNARIDQSSAFGRDKNTSFNSGLGVSWVLSKESFLSSVNWIDFLRLRISYGSSGNSRIGSYRARGLYNYYDESYGYNGMMGYATPSTAPNPNLGWERNYKTNLGLDFDILRTLNLSVEYFHDDIQDMIVSRSAIPESGYDNVQINGASMVNQGWEFSLSTTILNKKNFNWRGRFNISSVKNKVTEVRGLGSYNSQGTTELNQKVGYDQSVFWGYELAGIDPSSGRELYHIGDRVVDAFTLKQHFDSPGYYRPIGSAQPAVYGGMNHRFQFLKDFTIALNFSYKLDYDVRINNSLVDNYASAFADVHSANNLAANVYYHAWRKTGDLASYGAITKDYPKVSNSSKYILDASHIKLQSVQLSYKLPIKSKHLSSLDLNFTATNCYYWYLAEGSESPNGIAELSRSYPEMRNFSLGINARF